MVVGAKAGVSELPHPAGKTPARFPLENPADAKPPEMEIPFGGVRWNNLRLMDNPLPPPQPAGRGSA
jgi:hypothetical protein